MCLTESRSHAVESEWQGRQEAQSTIYLLRYKKKNDGTTKQLLKLKKIKQKINLITHNKITKIKK